MTSAAPLLVSEDAILPRALSSDRTGIVRVSDKLIGDDYWEVVVFNIDSYSPPMGTKRTEHYLSSYTSVEICVGGGGQALGLEAAGFGHLTVVDNDSTSCETIRQNRPNWNTVEVDLHDFTYSGNEDVDLLAGGVPCPPFSVAGMQLGASDERDLFPEALRLVREIHPKAVLLENVRGLSSPRFEDYRDAIQHHLKEMGYWSEWKLIFCKDYGVPQLRPRFILIALRDGLEVNFFWPEPKNNDSTVGETLHELMKRGGWRGADKWAQTANDIAPTIVGGSKKHGGADLGPTRAKRQWRLLGVDGGGIANEVPGQEFPIDGIPKLTARMVARLQGFPDEWQFSGKKTAAYRQIGNAFPPPAAEAIGSAIKSALDAANTVETTEDARTNSLEPGYQLSLSS